MKRLYQWLSERATFFRSDTVGQGTSRTVSTQVTVERQGVILLLGDAAAGFDVCPLCGTKLTPAQTEKPRSRLQEGSISQDDLPVDGTSP